MDQYEPIQFIAEEIEVRHRKKQIIKKTPDAPDDFSWRDNSFQVLEVLSSWFDFERRGKMSRNMQPHNLRVASRRGSWGVGRFFFRVLTTDGRIFDLYYDRAPEDATDRSGHWYLWRELAPR